MGARPSSGRASSSVIALAIAVVVASCAGDDGAGGRTDDVDERSAQAAATAGATTVRGADDVSVDSVEADSAAPTPGAARTWRSEERIRILDESIPLDHRLFGTNVPAWLGPRRLSDPEFIERTLASGTTLIRMPGGSWSNSYDFRACEVGDEDGCFWTWAARPSDFADYLQATAIPGMWTVSINQTAEQAAATVAFFNGDVDDDTVIGVDRDGVDWRTVGSWARLRADGGNPEPVPIGLWEIGNEVYGGRPAVGGEECASFGWESVWTCSGTEYVEGDGEHDGYLDIRRAMLAVDDTIEIGVVGVPQPEAWTDWGNEVLAAAGDEIDFYIVHQYGFDRSPSADEAVVRPREIWPSVLAGLDEALGDVPIAVTEYNLVSVDRGDTEQTMTRTMNALFTADTIGQMASHGVAMANHWNLASGVAESGTNYGMIDVDNDTLTPQFEALRAWAMTGTTLHETRFGDRALRVYPTRHDDGRWSIVVINVHDQVRTRFFELDGLTEGSSFDVTTVSTPDLNATSMEPPATTSLDASDVVASDDGETGFALDIAPYSINVVDVVP